METKKKESADIERKRGIFFQIGLITALSLLFVAFEWSTAEMNITMEDGISIGEPEVDFIPVTRPEPEQKKPEPIPEPEPVAEPEPEPKADINLVKDDQKQDSPDLFTNQTTFKVEFTEPIELDEPDEDIPVDLFNLSKRPAFPGGDKAMFTFIAKNTIYPEEMAANGITGKVYVNFKINKKGKVSNVKVVRGIHPSLDEVALEVVKSMPNWEPGEQMGKKVSTTFTLPINFILE